MTYQELKKKQETDFNEFSNKHIFYAFNNEQFSEGLKNIGITNGEKLIHIGGGGYMRKSEESLLDEVFATMKKEMKEFKKKQESLVSAIVYELGNHEYCITCDKTEALDSLGILKDYESGNPDTVKAVKTAVKQYMASID